MMESLKQFRKRHLSNDPVLALFALGCGKASAVQEMAHHSVRKIKDDGEAKTGDEDASVPHVGPSSSFEDELALIKHPMEPNAIDHPIRCPHPEPCVIQDGRALKERVIPNIKRKGQLPFLTANDVQNKLWSRRTAPSDCQIFPAASAPEAAFLTFLPLANPAETQMQRLAMDFGPAQ